ncbi:MAG: response regulator, partial [Candidatus Omnitrophica bacterium]|nr:response regulator [Candidatus Omnitrophota bacterium]
MDKGYSILCIDDEENILQSFNRTLGMEGFKVLLAGSGQEGLDILRKEKIDLILCDQRMPEMSGFEVLRIAK